MCPHIAQAQSSTAPTIATAGFQSSGVKAVIAAAKATSYGFSVQLIIQNLRSNTIYISPISGYAAGSGNTAIVSSGTRVQVGHRGKDFIGMTPCYEPQNIDFDKVVSSCVKSFPIENLTSIEPSQTAILGITYGEQYGDGSPGGESASFALKLLVREQMSSAKGDPLAAAASGKADDSPAGPAKVVTISFPLIPLGSDSSK
jgi:hypothetical protein